MVEVEGVVVLITTAQPSGYSLAQVDETLVLNTHAVICTEEEGPEGLDS